MFKKFLLIVFSGWHICSKCEKNASYMCYTCTFSLCKGCIKNAVIFCVRGNKGFCETCMRTVKQIENSNLSHKDVCSFMSTLAIFSYPLSLALYVSYGVIDYMSLPVSKYGLDEAEFWK